MTVELSVCLRDGYAVAAARGELDVTSSADAMSAIAALTARQNLARQSGGDVLLAAPVAIVWTAAVPGYADG